MQKLIPQERTEQGLRRINPLRDIPAVADLIELGFREELDPAAWQMLRQMRRLRRRGWPFLAVLSAPPTLDGFVWLEEGRIVGNLSLRTAFPRRSGGYLIGNVVVHPDYRRRGIARRLMEAALEEVQRKRGRWVGLEVRADNEAALRLYRSYDFREVGQTIHYLRRGGLAWPKLPKPDASAWRRARPDDRPVWLALARQLYGREQGAVLEVEGRAYTYGRWERAIDLWLVGRREWAWLDRAHPPRRALYLRRDRRGRFHLWELYLRPDLDEAAIEEGLALLASISRRRRWPVILLFPPHPAADAALLRLGFHHHRRLLQMRLDLAPSHHIPVRGAGSA